MTFDDFFNYGCIVLGVALFFDFALVVYLRDILNPIFGPKFKVNLNYWTWVSWSNRLARTGWYASQVGGPKMKHSFIPTSIGYDFRSRVSKKTFRICRVHQVLLYIYLFQLLTVGTYLTVVEFKPIVASWFH